jgi:RNA polymerase sigma-70 factor, ECF subfamily
MKDTIRRCKQSEMQAMSELYEKYKSQVYRTAYLLTRSESSAEDVTQDTFIRVFAKIATFDETKSFEAWLYRVTINVAKNHFRKNKLIQLIDFAAPSQEAGPSLQVLQKEQDRLLWKQIHSLPYKLQSVIILKYMNECSQEEIAEILNIPIGTVKSRINSGLKKLKSKLETEEAKMLKEVICYD